jgi:spermidine/putrescine-binding protein
VKYGVIGGLAAAGAASVLVYPSGWQRWLTFGRKPWEIAPGVVDYNIVKRQSWGPTELGFANEIRSSPPEARVLNIAQWYDYWPGSTVRNFGTWMAQKWGVGGVKINWTSNIYTSNEELFTWVTQTGKKFDLMFPTNYTVESLEKAGQLANMNKEWIPNYLNIFGRVPTTFPTGFQTSRPDFFYTIPDPTNPDNTIRVPTQPTYPGLTDEYGNGYNNPAGVDFRDPTLNGYGYRGNTTTYPTQKPHPQDEAWGESDGLVAVPYQWGTTGIGYRTDIIDPQDIQREGWDFFRRTSYTDPRNGSTYDFTQKMMMLDDMREVFTAALKQVGWQRQLDFLGKPVSPTDPRLVTADPTPFVQDAGPTSPAGAIPATYAEPPFNGQFQLSNNETEAQRLRDARDWLLSFQGSLRAFNTPQQGPWLVTQTVYMDQAWSGDVMYAVRPNTDLHVPVDYFVPRQGGARWIDNAVIHRECEKLWLAHEFINYIVDPAIGAEISDWNLYAAPNAWSFELLHKDPRYSHLGSYPDARPYYWNPAEDYRIYTDIAYGTPAPFAQDPSFSSVYGELSAIAEEYNRQDRPSILSRCEYQKDVGVRNTLRYFQEWRDVKF